MTKTAEMWWERRPGRRTREASLYLRDKWALSFLPTTLSRLASTGGGPVFSYRGRYREYQDEDLDTFARSKIRGRRRKASEPAECRVA